MKLAIIFKWVGRILAGLLFLLWGTFFCAHLWEWFIQSEGGFPPLFVWVAQFFHLVMVVGLGLMVKWEKIGTVIMLVGTISFFLIIDFNYTIYFFIPLLTLLPVVFFVLSWVIAKRNRISGS